MQDTLGRTFLPTYDGSPKSSAKSWVKKLDTYFQLHQVLEEEAIRVVALHLQGKAYAWWLFESSSLKSVNMSTYAKFTRRLVKIFDFKPSKISLGEQTEPKNSKPLHEMGGSMKITPFQDIVEGVKYLLHDFPRAKAPLQQEHSSQEEDMCVPFSRRDQEKGSIIDEA